MRGLWKLRALWMVVAACLVLPCFGQSSTASEEAKIRLRTVTEPTICGESMLEKGVKAALRLVCLRETLGMRNMAVEKAIIIGFVGGFVRSDDMKHPEVQFAAHLREAYPPQVHAEVFANHDGKHALRRVLELLSKDRDGVLTSREKERASQQDFSPGQEEHAPANLFHFVHVVRRPQHAAGALGRKFLDLRADFLGDRGIE